MGVEKEKMMQRMWGDSFFNAKKKADSSDVPTGQERRHLQSDWDSEDGST